MLTLCKRLKIPVLLLRSEEEIRRKYLHKLPGPPFQIRGGPGSFSIAGEYSFDFKFVNWWIGGFVFLMSRTGYLLYFLNAKLNRTILWCHSCIWVEIINLYSYVVKFIHIIFISYSSRNNCSWLKIILLLKTFFLVFTCLVQNEDLCLPRNSRCFLGQIMCFSAVFQSVRAT